MKPYWIALTLLALVHPAPAQEPAAPGTAPRIVCDAPSFDFGTADSESVVEHTFILRNAGTAPLLIEQVRPSCGCTVASVSQKSLQPGETSEVTSRLSLKGRTGHQTKQIMVQSNDPQQPNYTLTLQGQVATVIALSPDRLIFGQIRSDMSAEASFDLRPAGGAPFRIVKVETDLAQAKVEAAPLEDGTGHRVTLRIAEGMPVGPFNGMVRVHTDHPARPLVEVPFSGLTMGALLVAPPQILLTPTAEPVTRFIVVRPGTRSTFKIVRVEPPVPDIIPEIAPFGQNGYRIQLSHIVASRELNGQSVRIVTDSPEMPEILVPFQLMQVQPGL